MIDYHCEYVLILDNQGHPLPTIVLDSGKVSHGQTGFCSE